MHSCYPLLLVRTVGERLRSAMDWIRLQMIELNLFRTATTRTDPFEQQTGKISTRAYIILMFASMAVLLVYNASRTEVRTFEIHNPSSAAFEQIHRKYPSSLQCPCTRLAVPYRSFVSINPQFYPVCSSRYISWDWLYVVLGTYSYGDFRLSTDYLLGTQYIFSAMLSVCSLADTTLSNAWRLFGDSSLVTSRIVSNAELMQRTQLALDQFKSNTIADFKQALAHVQSQTRSSFSSASTARRLATNQWMNSSSRIDFYSMPSNSTECSCVFDSACRRPIGFYSYPDETSDGAQLQFYLPNFFLGCSIMESLMASTFECYFNETCTKAVNAKLHFDRAPRIRIFQRNSTRFAPETNVSTIADALMLEEWQDTVDYEQYFTLCASKLCSYQVRSRDNALYVLTTLLGLAGGLAVGLRVAVSLTVGRIRSRFRPRAPANTTIGKSHNLTIPQDVFDFSRRTPSNSRRAGANDPANAHHFLYQIQCVRKRSIVVER